jgi:hypothetical protein
MTMTLADRCDNQAIGGLRHIKWDVRGEFHGTHVDFFTTQKHCFSQRAVGLVRERRGTGAMGGKEGLLLLHGIWCGSGRIKSPLHIRELGRSTGPTTQNVTSACTGLVLHDYWIYI